MSSMVSSAWPTRIAGGLLIWTGNHYLKPTQQLIFLGTPDEQYWARLLNVGLWTLCCVGLGLILTARQPRPDRVVTWSLIGCLPLLLLLTWFPARHDVTVKKAPGVYSIQRSGRPVVVYLNLPTSS